MDALSMRVMALFSPACGGRKQHGSSFTKQPLIQTMDAWFISVVALSSLAAGGRKQHGIIVYLGTRQITWRLL
jgi:hypothetical protein